MPYEVRLDRPLYGLGYLRIGRVHQLSDFAASRLLPVGERASIYASTRGSARLLIVQPGDRVPKLVPAVHAQFLEYVPKMRFHRLLGDEQALGNFPVPRALHGEPGDAQLAGGEGFHTAEHRPPRTSAGRDQLVPGAGGERDGPGSVRELQPAA